MNRKKLQKFWVSILAGVLALLLLTACTDPTEPGEGDETVPTGNHVTQGSGIRVLEYAKDAVQTLEERKISLSDFSGRGAGESNYKGNSHYDGTNLVVSPYFTGTVGKQELPVYATPVYVATDSHGALHSFASVDVDFEKQPMLTVTLKVADSVKMHYAQVFSHDAASLSYSNQSIRLSVTKHGAYTIVINDDQDYAITVFVRTLEDEEAQIKAYQDAYGEENVIVYEPGLHEIDYILMLVTKYHDGNCEDKEILVAIDKAIKSSLQLRSKKELIENFIATINTKTDVNADWQRFVKEQRETDIQALIAEEKLKPEETRKFVENAFRDGVLKTTGTDVDRLMPPVSRFGGGGSRDKKKQTVIEKLKAFFEKYFGLVNAGESFAEDSNK